MSKNPNGFGEERRDVDDVRENKERFGGQGIRANRGG